MRRVIAISLATLIFTGCSKSLSTENAQSNLEDKINLGKALFFDKALSKNRTQSCATCHNPKNAFVDDRDNGVGGMASLGDDGKSLGDRNAPTIAYAMYSPDFYYDEKKKKYIGGQFHDGREADLKGQAGGPPLNPIEMGIPTKEFMIERLKENSYYVTEFQKLYGSDIFKNSEKAYDKMAESIAEFEKTKEFAPFDSKYDRYLKGEYELTDLEDLGKSLFFSNNNTNCATCHVLKGEDRAGETFTNYEYHNIGTPINHTLRAYTKASNDKGLLANPKIDDRAKEGKFKTPTLRNIAVTAPYMHNGVFKDLESVIRFYDKYNNPKQSINPETGKAWAEPEVEHSISKKELKSKKLTDRKIEALVAFLKILTDKKYEHLVNN